MNAIVDTAKFVLKEITICFIEITILFFNSTRHLDQEELAEFLQSSRWRWHLAMDVVSSLGCAAGQHGLWWSHTSLEAELLPGAGSQMPITTPQSYAFNM